MSDTIVYSVNQKRKTTDAYDLKVLTIASSLDIKDKNLECKIGEKKGAAGHVLLKYKSGGHLLTSMTHWVELMRIDTSEKKLFELAKEEYGEEMFKEMKMEYDGLNDVQQRSYISEKAAYFVKNQAPC